MPELIHYPFHSSVYIHIVLGISFNKILSAKTISKWVIIKYSICISGYFLSILLSCSSILINVPRTRNTSSLHIVCQFLISITSSHQVGVSTRVPHSSELLQYCLDLPKHYGIVSSSLKALPINPGVVIGLPILPPAYVTNNLSGHYL